MREMKSRAKQNDWPWKGRGLDPPAESEWKTGGQSKVKPPGAAVRQPTCGVVERARQLW